MALMRGMMSSRYVDRLSTQDTRIATRRLDIGRGFRDIDTVV